MFGIQKNLRVAFVFLAIVFLVHQFAATKVSAIACAGDCTGSLAVCNAGLTCSGGVCGQVYDACIGSACVAGGGWDATTCNSTDCTNAGTNRTASWSALSACTATCGPGTQSQTCNCGAQNNCAVTCTGPSGTCGEVRTPSCCVDQAPQAPVVTSVGSGCSTGAVPVTWTFGTGGCGGAWGYDCTSPSNTFSIMDGATTIASGIPAGTSPYSQSVTLSSGVHQIEVCASNGSFSTCSAPFSTTITTDTTAPPVPNLSVTAVNCGSISFSWPAVTDVGCYGNVDYWLQVKDSGGTWYTNSWGATSAYSISSPVVGTTYQAQIRSSDNGANHTNQSGWSNAALWTTGTPYCCATTTAALGPLSPNGTCNGGSAFPSTYQWTADPNASGYSLNIPGCLTNQLIVGGSTNTYVLTPAQQAVCANNISTGAVSWNIQATYAGGCSNSLPASATFNYDASAPPAPIGVVSYNADPTCLGRYIPTYTWNVVSDTGCAGLNANPYWSQGSSNAAFSSTLFGWNNAWGNLLSQTAGSSFAPGTTLYFHVQSQDALQNQSGWSGTDVLTMPSPSPYPTIHIGGGFTEQIGQNCYGNMQVIPGQLTLNPTIAPNTGVTYNCSTTNATYSCNFVVNNTTGLCVNPQLNIQMNATYSGYGTIGWDGSACNSPTPTPGGPTATPGPSPTPTSGGTLVVNVGDNLNDTPIYFDYSGSSTGGGGWFKLSNTSFNSRESGRQNFLPNTIQQYDSDDSTVNSDVLIGTAGVVVQNNLLQGGANTQDTSGNPVYSQNNWYTNGYQYTSDMSYLKYLDYIKARKDYKAISAITDITTDGIYSISIPVTLNAAQFDGKKVVLIVQNASATFPADFKPNNGSVAVLAKDIVIDPSVTEIDALIVGQTVSTGVSTTGLKIKGNLIDEAAMRVDRTQNNGSIPSLFIVFDPQLYLNILPYLSTSIYDWTQVQ